MAVPPVSLRVAQSRGAMSTLQESRAIIKLILQMAYGARLVPRVDNLHSEGLAMGYLAVLVVMPLLIRVQEALEVAQIQLRVRQAGLVAVLAAICASSSFPRLRATAIRLAQVVQ